MRRVVNSRLSRLEGVLVGDRGVLVATKLVRQHYLSKFYPEQLTYEELAASRLIPWKDLQAAYKTVWDACRKETGRCDFDSVVIRSIIL